MVSGGLPGSAAAPLLLPPAVPDHVGAGPRHRAAGGLQARYRPRRLPAAPLHVRVVPAHALSVPGPSPGRGRVPGLPVPGGEPDLGRNHREHPDRRVLLHLRDRPGGAVPRPRLPHLRRRPSSLDTGRAPRGDRPRPRLRGALGRALGRLLSLLRAQAVADAALAGRGGCARLRPGRGHPRAPARGLAVDDALRRPVDHRDHGGTAPEAPVAAVRGGGPRRPGHRGLGPVDGRPRPPPALPGPRGPGGRRPGRGRPRPGRDRRALRPVRAARPLPDRRGGPGRLAATSGGAGPRGPGPGAPRDRPRRPELEGPALLDRLELHRPRGEGAVAGLPRAGGHRPGDGGFGAGGRRVQRDPRAGGLDPDVRDHPLLQRPLHPRGRLQPGQPPDPPGLLPGLGAVRELAESRAPTCNGRPTSRPTRSSI